MLFFSEDVWEDSDLTHDSISQDVLILEENPCTSGCEEFVGEASEVRIDDIGMIKYHIVQNQVMVMPISS